MKKLFFKEFLNFDIFVVITARKEQFDNNGCQNAMCVCVIRSGQTFVVSYYVALHFTFKIQCQFSSLSLTVSILLFNFVRNLIMTFTTAVVKQGTSRSD